MVGHSDGGYARGRNRGERFVVDSVVVCYSFLGWRGIYDSVDQLVVFGSSAVGMDGPASDLDLLAIGTVRPRKTSKIDLLVRSPEHTESAEWLGSELAGHIALPLVLDEPPRAAFRNPARSSIYCSIK